MDPEAGKHPEVALSGAVVQNMGVRTARVERGTLWKYVRTLGRVEYDETRLAHVHPRAEGWIEGLSLRAEGEPVRKGQELASSMRRKFCPPRWTSSSPWSPVSGASPGSRATRRAICLRLLDVPDEIIGRSSVPGRRGTGSRCSPPSRVS